MKHPHTPHRDRPLRGRPSSDRCLAFARCLALGVAAAVLPSCSSQPPRVSPPGIDADAAAQDAITLYDANKNGTLDAAEIAAAPPFADSQAEIDADGDGQISADEISDRIRFWEDSNVGTTTLTLRVSYRGSPLRGATVELVPDAYLSEWIEPATGTTDSDGAASVSAACGFYRVKVTPSSGGPEIPAKYNSETTLGVEVPPQGEILSYGKTFELQ